jgi:pimeloyl-ACP methyl ester carboxylesterase
VGRPLLLLLLIALSALGCTAPEPDFHALYDASARYRNARRNPIIVIPGILGSNLKTAQGQVVWGAFTSTSVDPETAEGARTFAHPMGSGPLRSLLDDVVPDGALETVEVDLLGLHFELGAYIGMLKSLGVGGYQDQQLALAGAIDYGSDHYTCFQFDYDWRRDNVENARRLMEFIKLKKAYVEAENKKRFGDDSPVKFDIVAHSMGGLLTRYFLRYGDAELPKGPPPPPTWAGAKLVERAILVGTPNAGSASALQELVGGVQLSALLPLYAPALVGSLPSVYQLLPRARHGALLDEHRKPIPDLLDPNLWIARGWGLADPDQDSVLAELLPSLNTPAKRRAVALDHLRKCLAAARRFQAALDLPAAPPSGCNLYIVAGDAAPTSAVLAIEPKGELKTLTQCGGDGTVTRDSALMDERLGTPAKDRDPHLVSPIRWTSVLFVFSDHLGMTSDPAFTDNVLYLLLVDPRADRAHSAQPDSKDSPQPTKPPDDE